MFHYRCFLPFSGPFLTALQPNFGALRGFEGHIEDPAGVDWGLPGHFHDFAPESWGTLGSSGVFCMSSPSSKKLVQKSDSGLLYVGGFFARQTLTIAHC